MVKKALITGVTGQDGSYLANLLTSNGYFVYGAVRHTSSSSSERLNFFNLYENKLFKQVRVDLSDIISIQNFFKEYEVNEVYNLAAQSFVGLSFEQPLMTASITGLGVLNLLESIRNSGKKIKFYQASSSELYGKVLETPQSESTPFYPRSPYGIAKQFAHWTSVNNRESYDMFNCNGILFNHESPLRGIDFVTRKITNGVAGIKKNKQKKIYLGNLNAKRDWGFAGDYVEAMYLMLQSNNPDDYVISTGITHTVRKFVELAFKVVDIDVIFKGTGIDEKGYDKKNDRILVEINKDFYRPSEVEMLVGNSSKAKRELGWQSKTDINQLVSMMVDHDLSLI
jgi:GDPmannose 4,6-dehydratase